MVGAIIFQPINRVVPLRCLEEKYGVSNNHRERLMAQERRSQKRLSLNITNGHTHDGAHAVRDGALCRDHGQAGQLRYGGIKHQSRLWREAASVTCSGSTRVTGCPLKRKLFSQDEGSLRQPTG